MCLLFVFHFAKIHSAQFECTRFHIFCKHSSKYMLTVKPHQNVLQQKTTANTKMCLLSFASNDQKERIYRIYNLLYTVYRRAASPQATKQTIYRRRPEDARKNRPYSFGRVQICPERARANNFSQSLGAHTRTLSLSYIIIKRKENMKSVFILLSAFIIVVEAAATTAFLFLYMCGVFFHYSTHPSKKNVPHNCIYIYIERETDNIIQTYLHKHTHTHKPIIAFLMLTVSLERSLRRPRRLYTRMACA